MKSKKTMENNPPEKAREKARLDYLQKGKYAFTIGKGPGPNEVGGATPPSGPSPVTGMATGIVFKKGRPLTRAVNLPPIKDREKKIQEFLNRKKAEQAERAATAARKKEGK